MLLDKTISSRRVAKLTTFMDFAINVSRLSTCKRLDVGCVVCDPNFTRVYSIGFNGQPSNLSNDGCTNETGNCGCVHAELNALLKLNTTDECLLLATHNPCKDCAAAILNVPAIKQIIYAKKYRCDEGIQKLLLGGLPVDHIRQWCDAYRI